MAYKDIIIYTSMGETRNISVNAKTSSTVRRHKLRCDGRVTRSNGLARTTAKAVWGGGGEGQADGNRTGKTTSKSGHVSTSTSTSGSKRPPEAEID